jgi:hypothetical protein
MDADRYDDEVVRLYEALLNAWNRRDGDAMAATFADDGETGSMGLRSGAPGRLRRR